MDNRELNRRILLEFVEKYKDFFKRPLISKGFTQLKRAWQKGGRYNAKIIYDDIKRNKTLYSPMITELLQLRMFIDFIEEHRMDKDLHELFRKAIYAWFLEEIRIDNEDGTQEYRALTKEELKEIYTSINEYRLQVFVEAIIKFRRSIFKAPVIND